MTKDLRFVVSLLVVAIMAGCNGCFGCKSPVDQDGSTLSKTCDEKEPLLEPQKLDVLFVIDNSNSMKEEQEGVARVLTSFVNELRVAGGVAQDIRVGVITTTVYQHTKAPGQMPFFLDCATKGVYCTQAGKLQPVPDANPDGGGVLPGTGSDCVLDSESDPEFVAKFSRLVQQGVNGSGQETPFEALRLALTVWTSVPVASGGNGGFMRDGARLLIVVLTDEDDCSENFVRPSVVTIGDQPDIDYCGGVGGNSLTPVRDYFDILTNLKDSKGALKEVIYAAIAPVATTPDKKAMAVIDSSKPPPTLRNIDCPTSVGAGVRHRAMAEMFFSDLSNLDSICKTDYQQTLTDIAVLAGVSQAISVQGVPDPHVLDVIITRKGGEQVSCTFGNGGFTFEEATSDSSAKIHFTNTCRRRRDDQGLRIDRLCIF